MKKLIHTDAERYNFIMSGLHHYLPALKVLKEEYEALGIGQFDEKAFRHLTSSTGTGTAYHLLKTKKRKGLELAGITDETILEGLLSDGLKPIENLDKALSKVMAIKNPQHTAEAVTVKNISFVDGTFIVNNAAELLEMCKCYVLSEDQDIMYNSLVAIAKHYETFYKASIRTGLKTYHPLTELSGLIKSEGDAFKADAQKLTDRFQKVAEHEIMDKERRQWLKEARQPMEHTISAPVNENPGNVFYHDGTGKSSATPFRQ